MAQSERDVRVEDSSRATTRPARRSDDRAAGAGGAAGVLHLQRLAGNAAVAQAIQGGGLGSMIPVQRMEDEEADEKEVEEG